MNTEELDRAITRGDERRTRVDQTKASEYETRVASDDESI